MVEYKKAQFADIIADAKAHGRAEELKTYGLGKVTAKRVEEDGTKVSYKRQRTFLEVKRWYFGQYYPELLPKAKPKKKTMYDLLEEL